MARRKSMQALNKKLYLFSPTPPPAKEIAGFVTASRVTPSRNNNKSKGLFRLPEPFLFFLKSSTWNRWISISTENRCNLRPNDPLRLMK